MSKRGKVRVKCFSGGLAIAIVFLITFQLFANYNAMAFYPYETYENIDTPKPKKPEVLTPTVQSKNVDSTSVNSLAKNQASPDTILVKPQDSIQIVTDTFDVKLSKDSLDMPITYSAEDSGVLLIPQKQFILYGKSKTKYTDIQVEAAIIKVDQEKHLISAYGSLDTLGNPLDKPKLVQGDMTSYSDSIFFDMTTQRGLTKSTYLQEGEMFVYANKVKKVENNTLYAWKGRFTTCNLDTPHFAFRANKMKIIANKLAVSGPANPEFEGVPIPIYLPFGIYPLNRGRHSGLLPPQFAANEDFGLGLENGGFYKVINENLDITIRSSIYSYGGWNLNLSPRYLKRYKYSGGLNLSIQKTKILNRAVIKNEFTTNSSFLIGWNHSRDSKARPGTNFSASVNAGSTKYNQFVANNAQQNFQNQLTSSITYSKDWRGKYNLTASANHNQNNNSRLINLNLPTLGFNVVTFYPLQPKEQIGTAKWYEKLGIGYSGNLTNQVSFYDSLFSLKRLLDTTQWGASHSVPITLSLPQLGAIQIAPSISYEERWYGQKVLRNWNPGLKKVDTLISKGFYAARQMSFGISANTRIFGTYQFPNSTFIKAIRHEIRPSFGLSYKPDMMKKYYYNAQVDTSKREVRFSQFEGGIMGTFSEGKFGGISFGVDNLLEMKVKDKKDTSEAATKKVRLIDGFGFSSSYNLVADSFQLSPFNLYLRSTLFEKINITAGATLDPYNVNKFGVRQKQLQWSADKFKLGRITNGSVAVSTSFTSKSKDGKKLGEGIQRDQYMTPQEQQSQLDYVRNNPAEFTDFNIPWSLQLSYSLSFSRQVKSDYSGMETNINSSVNLTGDFSLTERWKMGGSTFYDFTTNKLQTFTMFVSREMHCWQMSINLTPIGLYRSFNISISPKSGILRDLKINRSRFFYNQ